MYSPEYLMLRIEEMSEPKKDIIRRIYPFSIGIVEHLAKIYVTNKESNWFGTVRSQIGNIQKVKFNKLPTKRAYFRYMYIGPIHSGIPWRRTVEYENLQYGGNEPTEEQYIDFLDRVKLFFKYISGNMAQRDWVVSDHKSEIDSKIKELFTNKE